MDEREKSEYEERRKQAFLAYQQTGEVNDIVKEELADFYKIGEKQIKKWVIRELLFFVVLYLGITGWFLYRYITTEGTGYGIVSALFSFSFLLGVWIYFQWRKRRKSRQGIIKHK